MEQDLRNKLLKNIEYYRKFIILFFILFITIILSFYISDKYRVSKVMERLYIYDDYFTISSLDDEKELEQPLCNFYIASAFRPYTGKNQMLDYTSTNILKRILRYGARFLYLDVYSDNEKPLVCVGLKNGNWKLSLNSLDFDEVMETIGTNAFNPGIVTNYEDPLLIGLNLNMPKNHKILKKIKESIIKHCGTRLLDITYGYNQKNIALEPIKKLKEKVVILSSEGFENSTLEEIINGSWNTNELRKINNKSIDPTVRISQYIKEDTETLMNYNKSGLSVIVPEEKSFFTRQYSPNNAFEFGCQFVCMYYQEVDGLMDFYATKFKSKSFILKPSKLRGETTQNNTYVTLNTKLSKEQQKDPILSKCNTEPLPYVPKRDFTSEPTFKHQNSENGMCFISTKPCESPFTPLNGALSLIGNEKNKVLEELKKGPVNVSAGIDEDGFVYNNIDPYVCCATEKNVPVVNKYIMSNICDDPSKNKGKIGIKAQKTDSVKTGFVQGLEASEDLTWVHPKICEINDVDQLKTQDYCVIATDKCPDDYEQNPALLENNYKLCCRKGQN